MMLGDLAIFQYSLKASFLIPCCKVLGLFFWWGLKEVTGFGSQNLTLAKQLLYDMSSTTSPFCFVYF
jgi:hypothetical protein